MILYKIPEFIIWVINTKKNKKKCLLLLFYYYYYTIILITSILAVSEDKFIENNKNSIIINKYNNENSVKTIISDLVLTTNSNSNNNIDNIKIHSDVGSVIVVDGNRNLLRNNNKSDHDNNNKNIIINNNNNSLNINNKTETVTDGQPKILTASSSSSASMSHKITSDINNIDEEDEYFGEDEYGELFNKSAKGGYIGAPCEFTCNAKLHHVFCDPNSNTCDCEKSYPVVLGKTKGCAKPKKLGEQCYYHETCYYNDANSLCVQVRHNAHCQCASGYHSVSHHKPVKRVFCTPDIEILTSDLPTLLGVTTGIAVLAGLICMVLHLFSKTKYPRHRNFGDANLAPPIMYSTDTVHSARPSSRSSLRSSTSIGSFNGGGGSGINISGGGGSGHRRPSSAPIHSGSSLTGSKGVLVSTSRTGAARSAAILLISCHISALQNNKQKNNFNSNDNFNTNSNNIFVDETMTKYLQKQLNQQKQLLHLELPSSSKKIIKLLEINGNTKNLFSNNNNNNNTNSNHNINNHNNKTNNNNLCHDSSDANEYDSSDDQKLYDTNSEDGDKAMKNEYFDGYDYYNYGNIEMGALPTPASEMPKVAAFKEFELPRKEAGSSFLPIKPSSLDLQFLGSRRPSLASVHSTSSSVRSYSTARFEKEIQQKEIRQEMKIRLAKLQHNQHNYNTRPQITIIDTIGGYSQRPAPTPSPLTPNSTDELLPAVDESQEVGYQFSPEMIKRGRASYHGPCSSTDAL